MELLPQVASMDANNDSIPALDVNIEVESEEEFDCLYSHLIPILNETFIPRIGKNFLYLLYY